VLHKKSDVVRLESIAVEKHSSLRRDIVSEPILTDHVGRSCGEELEESEKDSVEVHLVILYLLLFYFVVERRKSTCFYLV